AGTTLDLSLASLRSVSPHHLEYLRNMDTAASVSFSMTDGDQLTRLVSCTSESPKGLPRATLRACELLVLQAKLQISAADRISSLNDAFERESIRARLRVSLQDASTVSEGLTSTPRDVLELCGADGAAAYVSGEYRSIGTTPSEDAVRRLTGEIRDSKSPDKPWAANRLTKSSADSLGAAGCLLVTFGGPDDYLVWFRRRRPRQLRWLRDPRACATELIDPRKSIDTRLENIVDTSVPWSEADLLAAQLLTYEVNSALFAKVQAELAHLSQHDALTGLPNRRHLSHLMGAMLAGATPTNPIAAIFVDLNQFKDVNDEYGHDAGDHVLREAARRIAEITRASDVLGRADAPALPAGRIGGDEFVVLLPGADAATATLVVNRIRQSLLDPIAISPDLHLTIGAAMGVAVATEREAPQHLLRRADAAMYEDKHRDSSTPHR
ncbi:MAG: diguanylate cyclase, partial [Actinomycetia bacterium]|nr:diguanylate cyclase [Actinomycetes bacterium]